VSVIEFPLACWYIPRKNVKKSIPDGIYIFGINHITLLYTSALLEFQSVHYYRDMETYAQCILLPWQKERRNKNIWYCSICLVIVWMNEWMIQLCPVFYIYREWISVVTSWVRSVLFSVIVTYTRLVHSFLYLTDYCVVIWKNQNGPISFVCLRNKVLRHMPWLGDTTLNSEFVLSNSKRAVAKWPWSYPENFLTI
jgi:hypothetical protein